MKSLFYALILLSGSCIAQSGVIWEPEITVADGSVYGNSRPRATVVNGNVPIVIFGKSGNQNLYISRWNGTSFNTPISILPSNTSTYINNWTGPDIDSKGDTVIAIFKIEPLETGNVYSVRSTDGGLTFSDTIRVNNYNNGVAWLPSLGIDNNGNPVATYMVHDASWTNPRYVVTSSPNAGVSYSPELEVTSGIQGEACDCCPAEMIVKDNKQVLLYRNNENNVRDIHGVLSTDGGSTFSSNANVDSLNWFVQSCPATAPDGVFENNAFYTVFTSGGEGPQRVYISESSTSSGLSLTNRMKTLEPDFGSQNYPRISGENDTIVMAWQETVNGNLEIFCSVSASSSDPLTSLTSYKAIANESTAGSQYTPEIIYKNGFVHLFYADVISGDLMYRRGTISSIVGLKDLTNHIQFYPNPSNNGIFSMDRNVQIESIIDVTGKSVHYDVIEKGTGNQLILPSESEGVYFVKVKMNGQLTTKKLMIVK